MMVFKEIWLEEDFGDLNEQLKSLVNFDKMVVKV